MTVPDEAALDAAIPRDLDWSVPAPGSVASRFRAPSGELAVVSLGDPADPRVVLVRARGVDDRVLVAMGSR